MKNLENFAEKQKKEKNIQTITLTDVKRKMQAVIVFVTKVRTPLFECNPEKNSSQIHILKQDELFSQKQRWFQRLRRI